MSAVAVAAAILTLGAGCADVSQDDTVFACDADHPCPGSQVCSGTSGVCLDHAPLFYEDFETALDASRWEVTEQLGMVSVDATAGHWGDSALRTESTMGGGAVGITHEFADPLPAHVFLRVFVRQDDANAYAPYFRLLDAAETAAVNMHSELAALSYKVTRDAEVRSAEGAHISASTWMCFEVELEGLPATGDVDVNLRVYVDDVEDVAMRLVAPLRALNTLELGGYSMAPISTLFDDLIVDTQRVGCAR